MSNHAYCACLVFALSACGGATGVAPQNGAAVDVAAPERSGAAAANSSQAQPTMSPAAAGSTDKGAAHDTVIAQAPGDTRQQPNPLECDANGATGMVQLDGDRIRLIEMVQYKTGRATIKPQSVRLLDQLARLLCSYADVRVEIGVHTDSRGSSAHNLALSQKRAEAVRDYLYSRGVPYERVRAKGYGESAPISHVPSRLHRRTEVKVLAQ